MSTVQGGWQADGGYVTNGLIFYVDASSTRSYNRFGNTGIWKDLQNNIFNGDIADNPSFDINNRGSLVFNGTSQRVTYTTQVAAINAVTNVTMEAWFQLSISDGNSRTILSKAEYGYRMQVNDGSTLTATLATYSPSLSLVSINCVTGITLNTWYHAVATYDGTNIVSYNNGQQFSTVSMPTGLYVDQLYGFSVADNSRRPGRFWAGKIPIVRVYNRALTASEVLQNYNANKNRFGL